MYEIFASALLRPRKIHEVLAKHWLIPFLIFSLSAILFSMPSIAEYNYHLGFSDELVEVIKNEISKKDIPFVIKDYILEGEGTSAFYAEKLGMHIVIGDDFQPEVDKLKTVLNIINYKSVLVLSKDRLVLMRLAHNEKKLYSKTYSELNLSLDMSKLDNPNSEQWEIIIDTTKVALESMRKTIMLKNVPLIILNGYIMIGIMVVLLALAVLLMSRGFKLKAKDVFKMIATCTLPIGLSYLFMYAFNMGFLYYIGNIMFFVYANIAINTYRIKKIIKKEV